MGRKRKDITGNRFGRLIAISVNEEISKQKGKTYWDCQCDCGNTCVVRINSLIGGSTTSCGCFQKEGAKERGSKRFKTKWEEDEDFRKDNAERSRNKMNELWKDEDYKRLMSERKTELNKKMWENEEYREAQKEKAKLQWQQDGYREAHSGDNHWNYNDNITDEEREFRKDKRQVGDLKYKQWSKQIKEQANFICDICGQHGYDLNSHHLNSWNAYKEQRYDLANGVCLCDKCHKEFHHIYGQGNNTKEQYIEFKKNKLTKQEQ